MKELREKLCDMILKEIEEMDPIIYKKIEPKEEEYKLRDLEELYKLSQPLSQ